MKATASAMLLSLFAFGAVPGPAAAQTAKDLVGSWAWVSLDTIAADGTKSQPFGATPDGLVIFDNSGHFAWLISRHGRGKFASGNRDKGTPEENITTVQGSYGLSGTYSVSGSTLTFNVDASTFPNAEGAEQKRPFALTGDQLKWSNSASSTGANALAALQRVK
jgi:hypothetical protein